MRIFQVFDESANPAVHSNNTWYLNFYEPLVEMGHDVVFFSAEEGRRARQRGDARARYNFGEKLFNAFRRENTKKPFDLFFAYLTDGMVESEIIWQIKKTGVLTCNFSCNNAHQFHLITNISKCFDYNLHSERDSGEKFRSIGANSYWWPMASNPNYFKPYELPRSIDVSFVGANYALRARHIASLLEKGVDVHAFGPGWQWGARTPLRSFGKHYLLLFQTMMAISPSTQARTSALLAEHAFRRDLSERYQKNLHPPVSDEDLIKLYSQSHISLGFLEVHDRHDPSRTITRHLHLRDFEAPMSGALYCTGYLDELADFFGPDTEIVMYRNEQELLDKVKFFLAHPEKAEVVRKAGHRRALAEHTYHARFRKLFSDLGLAQ